MIPGIQHPTNHAQRLEANRTPKPTINVLMIETTPDGVLRRAARGGLYPKWLIRVAEYVVTTPLETEICYRDISIL